jgi:beta-galactosidase
MGRSVKYLLVPAFVLILHLGLHAQSSPANCAEVKSCAGVPTLFVNGKPYPPYAYMSYLGEGQYYREVAQSGIHLYTIPAYLGDRGINSNSGIGTFRSPIWTGVNAYDFSGLIRDFEEILEADPEARVIIRIHLDSPRWWEELNPGEVCVLPDGGSLRTSFSSEKWKIEAGEVLRHCVNWLLHSGYADHLIGIHVAGGSTEEWFYHLGEYFYDENPARLQAFRSWLRDRYQGDAQALQAAWSNRRVDFNNAQLADISGEERSHAWRDPLKEQNVMDTYRFHAETMVDHIAYFCRIVKESSRGCLLTGAFYGYHYFVTDPRRGHGALARLLDCPDLDYLSSPNDYKRVAGEDWPPMAAMESIKLHGKLWLAENDTRTAITTLLKDQAPEVCPPGQYESGVWLGPADMQVSVALLWKNTGRMLTHGYGGWWFDMWGGWFSNPALLEVLTKTQAYFDNYPSREETMTEVQVAVVVDEELSFRDASFGALSSEILDNRYSLGKTGAPYDLFLRSDFDSLGCSKYRLIWLMGILELNEEELSRVEAWRKQGITVLWTDGAGTRVNEQAEAEIHLDGKLLWEASQLRELWKKAGVHVYLDSDDVLYVGRGWLCVHTLDGGEKEIRFPGNTRVTDPLNGQIISESNNYIQLTLAPGSTNLYRLDPETDKSH